MSSIGWWSEHVEPFELIEPFKPFTFKDSVKDLRRHLIIKFYPTPQSYDQMYFSHPLYIQLQKPNSILLTLIQGKKYLRLFGYELWLNKFCWLLQDFVCKSPLHQ
jgi:hypothetical protein